MLDFYIRGQLIGRNDTCTVVSDSVGFLKFKILVPEEWYGYNITVQFENDSGIFNVVEVKCLEERFVPWEVIKEGYFYVSAFGVEGENCIATSNKRKVEVIKSGLKNSMTPQATPDAYAQYVQLVKQHAEISEYSANTAKIEADRSGTEAIKAVQGAGTAVEQAQSASINKIATDDNVLITNRNKKEVLDNKDIVKELTSEVRALVEEQKHMVAGLPNVFVVQNINDMNAIVKPKEKDFCVVLGSSKQALYLYYSKDINGNEMQKPSWVWVSDFNAFTLNREMLLEILRLSTVAISGDYNDITNKPKRYESFMTITDGIWDYNVSDKVKITMAEDSTITISNVYNGAVGIIQAYGGQLVLPENSKKSIDFDYINAGENEFYNYTFVYDGVNFCWSRTVFV